MNRLANVAITTLLALVLGTSPTLAGDADRESEHVQKKQAHFRTVVGELSARDISHLTAVQREARTRALAWLSAYSEAGRFPQDLRYAGWGVPYLIDDAGTRCALAHLIDRSGSGDIVTRLARTHNHAFVPGLIHDDALVRWLRDNGFTAEEAAFIQMPGWMDDANDVVEDEPDPEPPDLNGDPQPDITSPPPVTNDPTATPTTPSGARRRRPATGAGAGSWQSWWALNRQTFVPLRTRYHDGAVVTPQGGAEAPHGKRPGELERTHILVPLFRRLAKEGGDVGGAALMAWARLGRPEDAETVAAQALGYVADGANAYRGLMLLAVGLTRTERGTQALAAILADTPEGRRHLARRGALPERIRALAAVALALTRRVEMIDPLLAQLTAERGAHIDLRAACVAALGHLARDADPMQRARVRGVLAGGARSRRWADPVLAAVPAALLRMNDASGLESLSEYLARFRKPRALRESMALALGGAGAGALRPSVDVLLATARRDPDAQVRRYAIVGLGQRTPARDDEAPGADEARRVIGRFYMGALQGHHVQSADRPWVYLGAALHARRGPAQAGRVIAALRKAASGGGARGTRAAAAIALGLLGGKDATATLRELLATVRDQELRPYAAEALGIARDRESRGLLLALVKGDGTEQVRYRAALGLGYLADRELVGELVTALHGARSVPVRAALTRVIGEVGDRAAIGALAAIAADTKEDALTRGRAIAALGLIGETSEETWVEPFKRGANRAAATPSLRIVLSIF